MARRWSPSLSDTPGAHGGGETVESYWDLLFGCWGGAAWAYFAPYATRGPAVTLDEKLCGDGICDCGAFNDCSSPLQGYVS